MSCVTFQHTIFIYVLHTNQPPTTRSNIQNSNALFAENVMKFQLIFLHQKYRAIHSTHFPYISFLAL